MLVRPTPLSNVSFHPLSEQAATKSLYKIVVRPLTSLATGKYIRFTFYSANTGTAAATYADDLGYGIADGDAVPVALYSDANVVDLLPDCTLVKGKASYTKK